MNNPEVGFYCTILPFGWESLFVGWNYGQEFLPDRYLES